MFVIQPPLEYKFSRADGRSFNLCDSQRGIHEMTSEQRPEAEQLACSRLAGREWGRNNVRWHMWGDVCGMFAYWGEEGRVVKTVESRVYHWQLLRAQEPGQMSGGLTQRLTCSLLTTGVQGRGVLVIVQATDTPKVHCRGSQESSWS